MGDNDVQPDTTNLTKPELSREGSTSSIGSSPEPDAEPYPSQEHPPQKRKGGRKPIYATSEERKQRNRQAQAAFRERRTEYIKQLETTIKLHEETLQSLQQSHRSAADECLMLRYKNSLLERILLEKGIDVQAELRAKNGSPALGPTHVSPTVTAPTGASMRGAIMNRHQQARRSGSGSLAPKVDVGHAVPQVQPDGFGRPSPQLHATPTSQTSSPATTATRSPGLVPQGGINSPLAGPVTQPQQHFRQQPQPLRPTFQAPATVPQMQARPSMPMSYPSSTSALSSISTPSVPPSIGTSSSGTGASAYYPSPFQNHIDQLEQEYDAQADMIDEEGPSDHSAGPGSGPYPHYQSHMALHGLPQPPQQHMVPPPTQQQLPRLQQQASQVPAAQQAATDGTTPLGGPNQLFDPFDPMLDADPFGLSASMHFPTQFQYEHHQMR